MDVRNVSHQFNGTRVIKQVPSFKGPEAAKEPSADTVKLTTPKSKSKSKPSLSKAQKNEILHSSKITSSGWSVFLSGFSTLYFALRSDEKIARKYNLDVNKDKDFIRQIRRGQTIATIPSVLGLGLLGWIYFKAVEDPQKQVF